jgi:sulfite reductase (NADPH) flavoprotein alpha-component
MMLTSFCISFHPITCSPLLWLGWVLGKDVLHKPHSPELIIDHSFSAAPFRTFIQYRAHLAAQKIPVGPLIYYFGSRHRSQEYLYGEELEAYIADGILTHVGLAFSRDTKKKVYIQHKMNEDGEMLANMLADGDLDSSKPKGVFYLCGPTWPVPDVYEALITALNTYAGKSREESAEYLENLKEEERYVLEVNKFYFSLVN